MPIVAVVGLGYVGLPLAVAFGRVTKTIGFDLSDEKVIKIRQGRDPMGELSADELAASVNLTATSDPSRLREADVIVVAVPTPVDRAHQPDFGPLVAASRTVGKHLQRGATIVFESTVYPGATEEICIPVIEEASGMRWKSEFWVGYSPERINPGDKNHTLARIVKVVAGDTPETLDKVSGLYEMVVHAGVHKASSIRVAEAAKVIENTQRDLNIALMNELAIIFDRIGIDTAEVLEAAGTKWNFLRFKPGLVGGHCIGVDPYYLTHMAEMVGYHPQVILAGRRINDGMAKFIVEQTIKQIIKSGHGVLGARVSVLGITFKEDCGDLRNSKVADVIAELRSYGCEVFVHDPIADPDDALNEYGEHLSCWDDLPVADAILIAVPHEAFRSLGVHDFRRKLVDGGCVIDVKSALPQDVLIEAGYRVWRL